MTATTFGSGGSAVVEVRWAAAVDRFGVVNSTAVRAMVQTAVKKVTASDDPWSIWAGAKRRCSLKVNTITSQAFTHPELAGAVARGLVGGGCDPQNVVVWDRDTFGLRDRGYTVDRGGKFGFVCMGSDAADPPKSPVRATIARHTVTFSPILTGSDLLFSLAALKDHSMAGVTLSLKNNFGMIYGADRLHGDIARGSACEPAISELAAHAEVSGRLRLCLIDALVGVCHGGPGPADTAHAFRYGGILVSRDPVALDRRGLAIITARRLKLGLRRLDERRVPNPSSPKHIENAAVLGVGPG